MAERSLNYAGRVIRLVEALPKTDELIAIFVTSIRTAEESKTGKRAGD